MKLLQTIVFLAFYALASAEKLSNILRMNEEEAPRKASVRRRAKKDGSNGGEGPDDGQQDRSVGYDSCVELADVPPGILAATTAGDQCLTENACNNGCCRLFNFLICDEINDWFRLECVCNDFVRAQQGPVIPGLPNITQAPTTDDGGNRTDDTGGGVIDFPGGGNVTAPPTAPPTDGGPIVLPIGPDACAPVPKKVNLFQAQYTLLNFPFQACESASECQAPGECCAPSLCICGKWEDTAWGCVPSPA